MKRYSVKELLKLSHGAPAAIYKDQAAVLNIHSFTYKTSEYLFSIDGFAIGLISQGSSAMEINNEKYDLDPGDIFILAPTHTCRLINTSPDFRVRLLLLNSNGYSLSVHLNYIVKSERWTQTYFNPVIKLTHDEAKRMNDCTDRIVEQILRKDAPNHTAFLRLAITWHHVELDNIMQLHVNDFSESGKPLTRQQFLARQLYLLIVNNYRKEHHTKFYSDKMCLTPQYLNQISTNIFGKTLSSIITDLLFSTARTMILSSEMSIQEISDELNFSDQASFSKFIKKKAGVSPNALRKSDPHKRPI